MNIYKDGFIYINYIPAVKEIDSKETYDAKHELTGKHEFKNGQQVIEGKDYELKKVPCIGCEGQYSCYNWQIGDCRGSDATIVALPLTEGGGQGEKDTEILNNKSVPEYIICAAIHFKDDKKHEHQPKNIESGFVVCGRRHHNCFMTAKLLEFSETKGEQVQGFLTSKDIFLDRKEAGQLAFKTGVISEPTNCLFSEDLY